VKSQFEPWTPEEKAYLVENAQRFTAEYIALRLGRTTRAVFTRASRMKIPLSSGKRWTTAEVRFLEQNAGTMKTADIAAALGRDCQAVRNKACILGISLPGNRKYSAEDVELCRALAREGLHYDVIAEKMEIPAGTVRSFVYGWRRKNTTAQQG
jgi:hypothetical protein